MATRRWALLLLTVALISVLTGCGGSTFDVQNPPPPPPPDIAIAFQTLPPPFILINSTASLSAMVTNDSTNSGVDWSLTCSQSGNCGTLSATHTDSGAPVTYTPPLTLIGNGLSVNIVAYATADRGTNALASITINAFANVLNGTYVFQAQGSDPSGQPYQVAGSLALDGNNDSCAGYITSGQQTLNTFADGSVTTPITGATGTPCVPGPSYFFVGGDGRGLILLATTDSVGDPLTETFSLVVLSSSEALISEVDSNSAVGTLELQDPAAAQNLPSNGFALVASGADFSDTPIAFGAILNIDNNPDPGSISGIGSLGNQDYNSAFTSCPQKTGFAGSSVTQSSPGVVVFSLVTACDDVNPFGPTELTGYVVDASHIRLIETDGSFLTAGLAIGQGAQTGTFGPGSFSQPYVFGVTGPANAVNIGLLPASFTAAAVICPDGAGGLTSCSDSGGQPSGGYIDALFLSDNAPLPGGQNSPCSSPPCPGAASAELSGNYKVDAQGIGRVDLTGLKFNPPPSRAIHPTIDFYLTSAPGTGAPALVLYAGGEDKNYPAMGVGIAYPQQQPANASSFGDGEFYGLNFTEQSGFEIDGTGQMTSTLSQGSSGGTLSGLVDSVGPNFGTTLSDSFACPQGSGSCPDSFGRFSDSTFLGTGEAYYMIDSDRGFFVETDLLANVESGGTPQVTLGYFAQRCDVTNPNTCQPPGSKSTRRQSRSRHTSQAQKIR